MQGLTLILTLTRTRTRTRTRTQVETEQIVADGLRGALHEGGMCAAVQLRGSIPLMWGHGEQKQIVPRPDIHLQRCEPRASAPPTPPEP